LKHHPLKEGIKTSASRRDLIRLVGLKHHPLKEGIKTLDARQVPQVPTLETPPFERRD